MPTVTITEPDYASMTPKQLRGLYAKGVRNEHTRRAIADYQREKLAARKATATAEEISGGGEDIATESATATDSNREGGTAATAPAGLGATTGTPEPGAAPRDLTPPEPPKPAPPATVPMTPSTGTVRRLQALALIGITPSRISEITGLPVDSIWWLMMRPPTQVATPIHARIADAFRQLRVSPVTPNTHTSEGRMAARAIALAEALEWAGPFDWDDVDFDKRPSTARRHRDPVLLQEAIDAARIDLPAPLVSVEQLHQLEAELQRERDLTAELHRATASHAKVVDDLKADRARLARAEELHISELTQERALTAELRTTISSQARKIGDLHDELTHARDELTRTRGELADITLQLTTDQRSAMEWKAKYEEALATHKPVERKSNAAAHVEEFIEAVSHLPGISIHFHVGGER